MIARIIFFSTTDDDLMEGKKLWENEMVPALKKQKGFHKAFRAFADDEPGGVVIQLWKNKTDEAAWRSSPEYQALSGKLTPLFQELRIERDFQVDMEI